MRQERRILKRMQFERPARIITRKGEKLSVKSHDFSMEGAAFTGKEPIDIGEVLCMTLNVAYSGQSRIMKMYGRVVHKSMKGQRFFMGIYFTGQ